MFKKALLIIILVSFKLYGLELIKVVDDNNLFTSRDMSFNVSGNREFVLISTPKSTIPKNGYPVIIMLHGHIPIDQYSTINSYKTVFNNYAKSEFIIVKPDLRGHERSDKGLNYNARITQLYFIEDVLTLVDELKKEMNIDEKNIFLMGHSNGGSTTLRLLVKYSSLFNSALLWAPVTVNMEEHGFFYKDGGKTNLGLNALKKTESIEGINRSKKLVEEALKVEGLTLDDVRYLNKLGNITSPILIKHADTDQSVPYYWSEELIKSFRDSGNKGFIELINYPGDNHNLSKNWPGLFKEDLNWFRENLK